MDLPNTASNITAGYINATTYQVTQSDPNSPVLMTAYNVENIVIVARNATNGTVDTLSGGAGDDQLISFARQSYLSGGDGNDRLYGHGGTLDGGNGVDIAVADLEPAYLSGDGETVIFNGDGTLTLTDAYSTTLLKNIERIQMYDVNVTLGTLGDDTVALGDNDAMYLAGPGNDTITVTPGTGSHIIDGGTGNDTVLFSAISNYTLGINSKGDVTVTARSGYPANIATLVNVETVKFNGVVATLGTSGDDTMTGTSGSDILFAGLGNDTLDGGGGNDTAAFSGSYNNSAITFNLDGSITVTGPDGTDTLRNIENASFSDTSVALGTVGNDSVVLNGPTNGGQGPGFAGGSGNDTVTANDGAIFFDGGAGTDTVILPFNYQGYTPITGYPDQTYATQIGLARLVNVEIVQFNNATATLSNGQLTFTAAQPVLNNSYGSVFITDTGLPTTLDSGITLTNIGGSPMTGAVIKIASGFVDGDILSADLTGTSISASYDAATGTLTLSGADTAAHYQQVLRSVQMTANGTFNDHPSSGSVTWQVTNSDARANVSALVTTSLNLPMPRINFPQISETVFISGVYPNGKIAPQSFATWLDDGGLADFDQQQSNAVKWGSNTPGTAGGTVSYYFDPASGWTATEQAVISAGLALWSAEANINFAVTANSAAAGITFVRGNDRGAYTTHTVTAGDANVGQVNSADLSQFAGAVISIDTSVPGFGPIGDFSVYGGYVVGTVVHEEGHALGLGHAGPYNGSGGGISDDFLQQGIYDSMLWSLMSYIDPRDSRARWYGSYTTTGTNWGRNSPTTPMALDIAAAQLLYGAPVNSPLSGGQVFGFNTNITGAIRPFFDFTQNTSPVVTLFDLGANNTLDISGFSTSSTVNLNPGTFSSTDGMINNISIALNTKIDRFVGGPGNDVVTANTDGNALFGGLGNDLFLEGSGNDTIDGGPGLDMVTYTSNSTANVITHNVNGSVTVTGPDGTDTLTNIEKLIFNDKAVTVGSLPVADFNGAGRSDLVWQNRSGQPVVWLMNGSTVLDEVAVGGNPGPSWHVKGTGDFDGDGNADILWQNDNGQAVIWLMNGTTVLNQLAVASNPGPSWHAIASGDFNGDGKADILFQNDSGQAAVWLMNGATLTGGGGVSPNPGPSWHVKATGDFDGDGKSDILWQSDSGQAAIWLMNGSTLAGGGAVSPAPDPSWHVVGAGDFNGDFKSDIVWQNDSGQVAIWLMNGASVSSTAIETSNPGTSWHIKGTSRPGRRPQIRHPVAEQQWPSHGLADERHDGDQQRSCRCQSWPQLADRQLRHASPQGT